MYVHVLTGIVLVGRYRRSTRRCVLRTNMSIALKRVVRHPTDSGNGAEEGDNVIPAHTRSRWGAFKPVARENVRERVSERERGTHAIEEKIRMLNSNGVYKIKHNRGGKLYTK